MTAACTRTRCFVMSRVLAGVAGVLFGVGLLVAGMTQPSRATGFLDVLGNWDPRLAVVIAAALATYAPLSFWIRSRRGEPWFDQRFHVPTRRDLDVPLLAGSAVFGIGWGLGGFCPGPAIVAAGAGGIDALVVTTAMLVGLVLAARWRRRRAC